MTATLERGPAAPDELFTPRDLGQMAEMGISPDEAARQVELFRHPPPFTHVLRPCTIGDGIRRLTGAEKPRLLARWERGATAGRMGAFVPASGAASRMFKTLLAALADPAKESAEVETFFANLPRFPFAGALAAAMARGGEDLGGCRRRGDRRTILSYLLEPIGLGYADLPKGLILFHLYPEGPRTPFEEHLVEASHSIRDRDGLCRFHFTVPPEHEQAFRHLLATARPVLEERLGVRFAVTFSHQRRATDTLAVDPENRPFRLDDGTLLFRPGGHGALIGNLADLARAGNDLVFIKNVDNIQPDARKVLVVEQRRLLAGRLLELQERVFGSLERLESGERDEALLGEVARFLKEDLSYLLPEAARQAEPAERARLLRDRLDRPLRVCGIVRNTGEPGGGPFWLESPSGEVTVQIVETSQIDPDSPEQQAQLAAATHFSPTDLVCALRDRRGAPYDLHRYVDPSTAFVTRKTHEGRPLKALERPGLWNGAMAGWNTAFVEVPVETFAPVKSVVDLLRPEHQV